MGQASLSITHLPQISGIYFALLQCGYDFYPMEREAALTDRLRRFITPEWGGSPFFSQVRQTTCQVYPY